MNPGDDIVTIKTFLALLAGAGMLISLYFTLVYHRRIRPDAAFIPKICRMDGETCGSILGRPEARLLGIPNFYLGLIFYALVPVLLFTSKEMLLFIPAGAATIMSGWLAFVLLFRLKINCVLCFANHSINLLILLLLVLLWAILPLSTTIAI